MNKKLLLCLFVTMSPLLSFAQGCITIFSEDGDRFFLVMNGVKQNAVAQTNVRVDMLTNEYYSAKILFEQPGKPEISKNIPVKDPGTSDWAEVTYKIKRQKDGDLKLRYFSATPVPVAYNPPPDMYVMHYGQVPPPPTSAVTSVTQTTYTTTNTNPNGASMNVNAGGMNMNVNVGDPSTGGGGLNMNVNFNDGANVVTQNTTTTTTRTTTISDNYDAPPPPPARTGCAYPMDMTSFGDAKKTISGSSFEDTKLSTAKSILGGNCVSTDQVVAICKLFTYEQSKLDFAKFAYAKTTDRGNYFKVGNVFTFDASKAELNEFISK